MSANSYSQEAAMTKRSTLPCVLSWDANGELANHDRYDLLQADAALDKTCALPISSETSDSGEWPPSCKFHGPSPARRRL